MREYFVASAMHIDLAWKKTRAEMTEMLEILTVRLLDALDHDPAFRYTLEQAAHYRTLQETRPDLVARLGEFVRAGRLEMAGGMASSLETNLPNGECFVRNAFFGAKWVRQNFGVEVRTGWLIDTFGVHAQTPQLLRQFGLPYLMANRFGGNRQHDIFRARGLDGSEITVIGRDTYSPFVRNDNVAWLFTKDFSDIHRLFADADALVGQSPFLVTAYTENEMIVSLLPARLAKERAQSRSGEVWRVATFGDFCDALARQEREFPVLDADMNPEFTGCFSLRPTIRLRNREVETLLLEAEKWASLLHLQGYEAAIESAWWRMAFVQFHDVFTGSHPAAVFDEAMAELDAVEETATRLLADAMGAALPEAATEGGAGYTVVALNGLPWARTDLLRVTLPDDAFEVVRVTGAGGTSVPFAVQDSRLCLLATLPAVGTGVFVVETGANVFRESVPDDVAVGFAAIENEFIRLECDTIHGIRRLIYKPSGAVLLENASDFLVAQEDGGSFQIEQPCGAEVAASSGTMELFAPNVSPLMKVLRLRGVFPALSWAGAGAFLSWEARFGLVSGVARLDLSLRLVWRGERSRLRLKIPTLVNSSEAIYEIPFGTVPRKPYGVRGTARGEYPAHRFVAIEDGANGLALVNAGAAGVEIRGSSLITTLLRAPATDFIGMMRDETSSQHGSHEYRFALVPYAGTWADAGVAQMAQEVNTPVHTFLRRGVCEPLPGAESLVTFDSETVVLSTVKAADDGADSELVIRLYETAGRDTTVTVTVRGATAAFASDVTERVGEPLAVEGGAIRLTFAAYEIVTVRVRR